MINKKILFPAIIIALIIIVLANYFIFIRLFPDIKETCKDGTPYKECSVNKPFYCSKNLKLNEKCNKCGCVKEKECREDGSCKKKRTELKTQQFPFGLSNPYGQNDDEIKTDLPNILNDLGLSKDKNGVAGFIVDEIARKHIEETCSDITCQNYDFSLAKDLIDLVVGQGKVNLWVVLGSPSNYKFTDGKIREDGKTYLPDGPISRQAYRDYLIDLVNYVNSYGREVSGDSNWHVLTWNLYNEVNAEYKSTFEKDIDKATTAYANFVIDSSKILREFSPQSEIVLAGAGSRTDLQGSHGEFYNQVFSKLKQTNLDYDLFDYWESHWFGEFKNYKTNEKGYEAKDFIKFLQDNGYGDKKFLIRAGATYSGQDTQERKQLMNNYQSESNQAEFLIKRFVYNIANGVEMIPWSTIYERDKYHGERHVHFQYVSLIYDGTPDGVSKNQECVEGWLPCPDPGYGVKKLSYYAYKLLIEKLKGSGFEDIETINTGIPNIYIYKFNNQGKSIWITWWDYYDEVNFKEGDTKEIIIDIIDADVVKITKAIPKYDAGKQITDYNMAFNSYEKEVIDRKIKITLDKKPIYIEIVK